MTNRTRKYLGLGLLALGMALVGLRTWDFLAHRREIPLAVGTTGLLLAVVGGATIRKARRAETEFPAP